MTQQFDDVLPDDTDTLEAIVSRVNAILSPDGGFDLNATQEELPGEEITDFIRENLQPMIRSCVDEQVRAWADGILAARKRAP